MIIEPILAACGVAAALALACGAALGWAAARLPPSADRLVEEIDALLPQTQCGQCSYPGCRPYARAIARGEVGIDRCPPGGATTLNALARLLDRAPGPAGTPAGVPPGAVVAYIDEDRCIGCARCLPACPVDAIVGAPRQMHTVLTEPCTGCGLCLPPCPVDCIELRPVVTGVPARWHRATFHAPA